MSTDAAALPNDVAACHALIAQQFSTMDDLQHKLTQLEHYVAQLVRARFGPRSERLDPNQLTLFVATAMEVPPSAQDVVETAVQAHSRRGGGRNELPAELPRDRIEHDLAEQEKLCPGCGQRRQRIDCETSEQLELIPAQLKVWSMSVGSMPVGIARNMWRSPKCRPSRSAKDCPDRAC